jgi:tripartite-type tricarboxylate transporter receptor subunit TctC
MSSLVCRIAGVFLLATALAAAAPATAQAWPDGPVRIVVPYRPGTGPDTLARDLAERLTKAHGQPVIVENRDGANGVIGTDLVAKAAGDGRTLLVVDSLSLPVNAVMLKKVPFDWRKDLKPVTPVADVDLFVYTTTKRDFRTVADAMAFARANPGVLNYGVVGNGSVSHLSMERLLAHQQVKVTKVNYNGIAQVVPALTTGEIDLFVLGPAAFRGHVAEGRVRVLVTGSEQRSTAFPDAPTLREAGLPPGLMLGTRFTLFAPGTTPDPLVARIHAVATEVLRDPGFREKFTRVGLSVVTGEPGAEARRLADVAAPVEALVKSLDLTE